MSVVPETPTIPEVLETHCLYCTPNEGDIEGTLLIVQKNHLVVFTPTTTDKSIVSFAQCIIHIKDCFELGTVTFPQTEHTMAYYVQMQFKAEPVLDELILRNIYMRFESKMDMIGVAKVLLAMKADPGSDLDYDPSITQIPCYSDHMNLSPIVSPETKKLPSIVVSTGAIERPIGERATPSPRGRGEDEACLLLSPPSLYLDGRDKPAIEFGGSLLADKNLDLIAEVRELLPLEFRYNEWRLIYSPKIHGISIPSFYRHFSTNPSPCVILVTDAKRDCLFGAFCRSPWSSDTQRRYYGSNEIFLFSLKKKGVVATRYFPWIPGSNTLFQYSDDKKLVIGGGPSGSGLALFENWLRGVSNACETFGTQESLCCSHDFVVGDIEFWGVSEVSSTNYSSHLYKVRSTVKKHNS